MVIQTNLHAIDSWRNAKKIGTEKVRQAARLSSGERINSSADDAAGLAISEKMRSQIRGLLMASKNSQDGISLVQTAEGALAEIDNMLQRMRELSVHSANDTNTADDREKLDREFQQLKLELNEMTLRTEFNTRQLLSGAYGAKIQMLGFNLSIGGGMFGLPISGSPITPPLGGASGSSPAPISPIAPIAEPIMPLAAEMIDLDYLSSLGIGGTASGTGWVYYSDSNNTGVLEILDGADVEITGTFNTNNRRIVVSGATASITFNNANIINVWEHGKAAVDLCGNQVSLNIIGTNNIETMGEGIAGIRTTGGSLSIDGTGTLNVKGAENGNGAAIGGAGGPFVSGAGEAGGKLVVLGGTINATGGVNAAAIGGGYTMFGGGAGGEVIVLGGTVNATGGQYAAGIGGARGADGGTFSIDGGTVNATGGAGTNSGGAGIGGGNFGGAGTIHLYSGDVAASGGDGASGIGMGAGASITGVIYAHDRAMLNRVTHMIERGVSTLLTTPSSSNAYAVKVELPSGVTFAPNTDVTFKIGSDTHTVKTDASGNLYVYMSQDFDTGLTFSYTASDSKVYEATLTAANILTNHAGVVSLSEAIEPPPVITAGFALRTSDSNATVTFTSDQAGDSYQYVIVDKDDTAPTAQFVKDNGVSGGSVTAGGNTLNLSSLTAGDKDIYIIVTNSNGDSNLLKMGIAAYDDTTPVIPPIGPSYYGGLFLQIGANSMQSLTVYIESVNATALGIKDSNILTVADSTAAITAVDNALTLVVNERAKLGAYQNRLEFTIKSLDISSQNLSAAESRIRDTDMAKAMMGLTKANVLQQAAFSMMAQANTRTDTVLSLLR